MLLLNIDSQQHADDAAAQAVQKSDHRGINIGYVIQKQHTGPAIGGHHQSRSSFSSGRRNRVYIRIRAGEGACNIIEARGGG
jgi:hypothetical protein